MKRTKQINLAAIRKKAQKRPVSTKSMALTGTLLIAGCGGTQEAAIYRSAEQCALENPNSRVECERAYDSAAAEAQRTAPKYSSQRACDAEFGYYGRCVQSQSNSSWFIPALGGFMLGRLSGGGYNYGQPSPLFGYRDRSWVGADGTAYGSRSSRRVNVPKDAFKPKPATTRTISRGGFGSKIQAKSSWGSSRSRGFSFGG